MSLTRTVEFDAFGPWILPVTTPDEVPRAFHEYPFEFDSADFILKLPRDIERRNANPAMHLYDRLLIVDAAGLTVLTRTGDGFDVSAIGADTIAAVAHSSELLDGLLTVHGTDGALVEVPFNGVSIALIVAVANRLGALAGATSYRARPSDPMAIDALGLGDVALANAYREAAATTSGLRVRAAYAGTSPASKESIVARALKGRARLSGAVICANDAELIVLSRRSGVRRSGKPDLSSKQTTIVRSRVTGVEASAHPSLRGVTVVTIALGDGRVAFDVPADGDAVEALRAR